VIRNRLPWSCWDRTLTVEDTLQLPEIAIEIPLAELYDCVDLPQNETFPGGAVADQQGSR